VPEVLGQVWKKIKKEHPMNMKDIFQKYAAVVFFDTETTGLDARTDQIIELAALRVERTPAGRYTADHCDLFVKLPEGQKIPEKIVELTHITDAMLEAEGISEATAAEAFAHLIDADKGPVLLVAHNAQFDLLFVREMLRRHFVWGHSGSGDELLEAADYLDTLTVYKDRRPYPHKLANAISAYKLQDKVQNTHLAIDDVAALYEVVKAMDNERADLLTYVNIFGYNPKYGVSGYRIDRVTYWPQQFNNYMQAPNYTLPAKVSRRSR
jgi:DNA polymerase-3 subunit epsilon